MCYAQGSIDQAVNPCPMCKVFPHTRCPHVRETCRNRNSHPRFDVLFLKNAEVDSFNGCGYCKWAHTTPPAKLSGYYNPGWPGCCRPPLPSEHRLIQAADWRSVSIVHHVPIPPDIKAALDSLSIRGSPIPPISTGSGRSAGGGKIPLLSFDRRNSGNGSPSSRAASLSGRTAGMAIPGKSRTGGSPKQTNTSLAASLSRSGSGHAISTSVPTSSSIDLQHSPRRLGIPEFTDKRVEGTQSLHSSPNKKHVDLENTTTPRRGSSARRPTISPSNPSVTLIASSTVGDDRRSPESKAIVRRRASVSSSQVSSSSPPKVISSSPPKVISSSPPKVISSFPPKVIPTSPPTANASTMSPSTPTSRFLERPKSLIMPRTVGKDEDALSSASSSSGSSDGVGSLSDSTVTSDGGFTDYLSDESEAELQRQAEARAALVAQNQAEELEFKAARQQLAHIDLRPPKTWNPTNITNSSQAAARLPAVSSPSASVCPPARAAAISSAAYTAQTRS